MSVKARAYKSALGGIISVMLTLGCYVAVSVYAVPLSEEFGVSVGQVSLLFTCAAISGLLSSLIFGSALKKMGVRPLVLICAACLFSLFGAIAFAQSIIVVYVGAFFFGIATTIGGYAIAQTEITWWFAKGQGKLMGLITVAIGCNGVDFTSNYYYGY